MTPLGVRWRRETLNCERYDPDPVAPTSAVTVVADSGGYSPPYLVVIGLVGLSSVAVLYLYVESARQDLPQRERSRAPSLADSNGDVVDPPFGVAAGSLDVARGPDREDRFAHRVVDRRGDDFVVEVWDGTRQRRFLVPIGASERSIVPVSADGTSPPEAWERTVREYLLDRRAAGTLEAGAATGSPPPEGSP